MRAGGEGRRRGSDPETWLCLEAAKSAWNSRHLCGVPDGGMAGVRIYPILEGLEPFRRQGVEPFSVENRGSWKLLKGMLTFGHG